MLRATVCTIQCTTRPARWPVLAATLRARPASAAGAPAAQDSRRHLSCDSGRANAPVCRSRGVPTRLKVSRGPAPRTLGASKQVLAPTRARQPPLVGPDCDDPPASAAPAAAPQPRKETAPAPSSTRVRCVSRHGCRRLREKCAAACTVGSTARASTRSPRTRTVTACTAGHLVQAGGRCTDSIQCTPGGAWRLACLAGVQRATGACSDGQAGGCCISRDATT